MDADPRRKPFPARVVRFVTLLALVVAGVAGWGIQRVLAGRGHIRITTKPAGASVTIDGIQTTSRFPEGARWTLDRMEIAWSAPLTVHRQPGTYDVQVALGGYVSRGARVAVRAGETSTLDVELEPITDMRLEIASIPSGRMVELDGHTLMDEVDRQLAKTNVAVYAIRPGRHDINIPGDCRYQDWRQIVELQPGAITRVEATLVRWPFPPGHCTKDEWLGR